MEPKKSGLNKEIVLMRTLRVGLRRTMGLGFLVLWGLAGSAAAAKPDSNFHLYLLIGQSNMAGRGKLDRESKNTNPKILMLTKDLQWQTAADPLHFDKSSAAVGPGLAFGKAMASANPKVKIGLVPCAVGGTSIKVWMPGAMDRATQSHPFDDALRRMKEAQKTGVLKGIIWHQGESDYNVNMNYGAKLTELIERLRKDLNAPEAPFIAGELTPFLPEKEEATAKIRDFNKTLQGLAASVKRYACVRSDGLSHGGDRLHYSSESARELGKRYAKKMIELENQ